MFAALDKRASEADAEQKVAYPLLTNPIYLAIPDPSVKGKQYLRSSPLEKKAGLDFGYIPDFVIWLESLPVLVCEVKSPIVDSLVGYREASLYARHINTGMGYGPGINPCTFVLATNGVKLLYGNWDAEPTGEAQIKDLVPGSDALARLVSFCGISALLKHARREANKLHFGKYIRPASLAGREALLGSKLPPNTFAADLAPVLRRYFTSTDQATSSDIYKDAYVPTSEAAGYDAVLDSLLKDRLSAKNPLIQSVTTPQTQQERLTRVIESFDEERPVTGQLQLMIGHVGAGKSLYIRRFKELLIAPELKGKVLWAFVDFNNSPPSLNGAERWFCERFVESFESENAQIDFDSEQIINAVFSADISRNKAIYARLEKIDSREAALQRIRDLNELRSDPQKRAVALCRHFGSERNNTIVCVLDNVDKKDLQTQLDAFQLALWFKSTTRAFVIMQMRDETYERFKDHPPLDSYRSGVVFHISAPRFAAVVSKRLELSLEYLAKNTSDFLSYRLPNGMQVRYPNTRAGEFLKEIYVELFVRRVNVSRMLQGIAGADVRKALDMFFSILVSGYLSEDRITSYAAGARTISIPDSLIIKILMRTDYRFFHDQSGFIKNIFTFDQQMKRPNNFMISNILYFLAVNRKTRGEIGLEGYFSIPRVCDEMALLGYDNDDIFKACSWLLQNELIESDHMKTKDLVFADAVRISSSGFMHLRVLSERRSASIYTHI